MWRWPGLFVVVLVVAACGVAEVAQPAGPLDSNFMLSDADAERVEIACEPVLVGLMEGSTAPLGSALEDLDAVLSSIDGTGGLREYINEAANAMPGFDDTRPSDAALTEAAPSLIELSNRLISVGAERGCAGIGEIAASWNNRVVDRDSIEEGLVAARGRWASNSVPTYLLELSFGPMDNLEVECGISGSLVVQVSDGQVDRAVDRDTGCQVDFDDPGGVPLTVEDLFALVEEHLTAELIDVNFEPTLGYPRMIYVEDGGATTEVSVTSFTPGEAATQSAAAILVRLAEQRQTWANQDIDNYMITVEIGCFCPEEFRGPFEASIVKGDVTTVTRNGNPVEPLDETFLTVEGLFSVIEDYAYSDEITITYASLGYPTVIDIDPSRNTIDEELRIDVYEFVANTS